MGFFRSPLGALTTLILVALLGGCAFVFLRVHGSTHPPRQDQVAVDFESMLLRMEEVTFPSSDGIELASWRLRGDPSRPVVILCHDNGASKSSLVNLAIALGKDGFNLLLFDFRAHGESGGDRSTLGLREKRDVLGAIDFVGGGPDRERARRVGIYAVGTGAHAAALAAQDRPNVTVLVLERLYPDVGFALSREVFAGWSFGTRYLSFIPATVNAVTSGAGTGSQRAADAIAHLVGRDLLLVAPEGDEELGKAMQTMYERIPEQIDADGNLVFVPLGEGKALYGEAQSAYYEQVREFFYSRLVSAGEAWVAGEGDGLPAEENAVVGFDAATMVRDGG